MSAPAGKCRICSGPLELRYRGTPGGPSPESFSPTYHGTGQHGDLFICRECATVQQPSLPGGDALHGIYREMSDQDYLVEEEGRRATARRLLEQVGGYVAHGSLLDVGCGHGVLLDEARKLGYETTGLELSSDAARHARDAFGLDVHEVPLERFDPGGRRFDVVMLADVIEHLEDPVSALDRCYDLLADGGVLCVVTPDPSSRTAQLAGSKWWGYIPAHMCLLPRKTLRELMAARGLVISEDGPLVRTFSAGYWFMGMAERSGPIGSAARADGEGARRQALAHHEPRRRARDPRPQGAPARARAKARSRTAAGRRRSTSCCRPTRRPRTIPTVAKEIPVGVADRALLVDDASPDDTTGVALQEGFEVIRHPGNRGYGANQMTCYTRAILDGADIVVMVHADNQYDPSLVAKMVRPIERGEADVVIGSRLLEDEAIAGGMPRWKWVGNRFLTWVENRAFRTSFSEFHTGYRAFSADILREIAFLRNSDGFVFDQEIFAQLVRRGARVHEIADPHALLPRGVERLVHPQRRVRPADAGGAGQVPPGRAPAALAARAAPGPRAAPGAPGRGAFGAAGRG